MECRMEMEQGLDGPRENGDAEGRDWEEVMGWGMALDMGVDLAGAWEWRMHMPERRKTGKRMNYPIWKLMQMSLSPS